MTVMIGPLTGDEWASLFLHDDPRNPLPPCCADLAEARDVLAQVMREGGDPDVCASTVAMVWPAIADHFPPDQVAASPVLRKLHDAYVAGRELPADLVQAHAPARARVLAADPVQVKIFIEMAGDHDAWDLTSTEGRMRALQRLGGRHVARINDDGQRREACRLLADRLGMDSQLVGFVVDVLRLHEGFPYATTQEWVTP